MSGVQLGISVSDYSPLRGHTHPAVYDLVDYIEYGGFAPPGGDAEVSFARTQKPSLGLGRHLVMTELPAALDIPSEARRIVADVKDTTPLYYLTDAEFWHLGGYEANNIWVRPCSFSQSSCETIAVNCAALEQVLGMPILVENPAIIAIDSEITIATFFRLVADSGAHLCMDIGHFWAYCRNNGLDVNKELDALPFNAFRVAHIAGLSRISYCGREFFIDNHDVPPTADCLDILAAFLNRAPEVQWVTYEAELAATDVQIAGLLAIREIL
ncbi:MAG: DUF692 family multinuclear iron-containing protein [Candidatus Thiodiazotropha endolucinida]